MCVGPTLFGIFFSMLLQHAFKSATEGLYIHTRSDGKLFNLACLRAKSKVRKVLIRNLLFADDAALTAPSELQLPNLIDCFSAACDEYSLTISLKKTTIMAQGTPTVPKITIKDYRLEVVNTFTYLGSTTSDNLSWILSWAKGLVKQLQTSQDLQAGFGKTTN